MKNLALAAVTAIMLGAFTTPAPAQSSFTLDQVFAKLDETSKTFKSITANVEQTHVTVIVDDKDIKSGTIFYTKRVNEPRLKLEFNKPQSEFVLIDNGKLQIYTPKIKQVQEASTAGHQDLVQMFLALGFGQTSDDLKKNFTVTLQPDETVDGQKRTVLELTPKNSGTFKSVRMWLDQKAWVAAQIKTVEKTGDYLVIKYSNVKLNNTIPESRFKLDLPKDVKVIKL
jgi:outer membrane lipoprotein-sorting protein